MEQAISPGDFAVICTGTWATPLIERLEKLNSGHTAIWDHAVVCTRVRPDGTVMVAEAEPHGARETEWHYQGRPHLWSSGYVATSSLAGPAAARYTRAGSWGKDGVPYSFLDYAALAARRFHLPVPGLRSFIQTSYHMICSQLVDQAEQDVGVHLFRDGRWPGYVTPQDLGDLIAAG